MRKAYCSFNRSIYSIIYLYNLASFLPYCWVDVGIKAIFYKSPHNTRFAHTSVLKNKTVTVERDISYHKQMICFVLKSCNALYINNKVLWEISVREVL